MEDAELSRLHRPIWVMAGHTLANAALRLGFDEEPAEAATVSGWRWLGVGFSC